MQPLAAGSTPAATFALECSECGATLALGPAQRTAVCPYCASPNVVERPPSRDRPAPHFALAFVLPPERATAMAKRWARGRWLAPEAFRRAPIENLRGVYLPAYLYGAAAFTQYHAQIGENYTETESYTTTDSEGRTVRRTRTVTKTEWRALSGQHAAYVSDVIVTASRGIPNDELQAIEPFDLRALRRYSLKIISGWMCEDPSMAVAACAALARQEALAEIGARLGPFMPGDSHRDLRYQTTLQQENAVLTLLPVWVLAVRYRSDKPPVRLLVNGQTGAVFGRRPLSWLKASILLLVALALIAGVALALGAAR